MIFMRSAAGTREVRRASSKGDVGLAGRGAGLGRPGIKADAKSHAAECHRPRVHLHAVPRVLACAALAGGPTT